MENINSIDYLLNFGKSGKPVKDLSRIKSLLDNIGNPQNDLKFIHIAGTNGKGSTLEMISNGLINAGYKVGQFTSPFVRRYTDRIRINGGEIPVNELDKFVEIIKNLDITPDCSQFEITFAIALLYFKEQKCDIAVIETGIGGLLDATNIIENPLCSVITTISFDHMAILGNTIEKIAYQKAGIIKPNNFVIVMPEQDTAALNVIKNTAKEKNATVIIPDTYKYNFLDIDESGVSFSYKEKVLKTAMTGKHQLKNAETAITTLEFLRYKRNLNISDENIEAGIETAKVEGRIQFLRNFKNAKTFADGGHNIEGISAMCEFIKTQKSPKIAIFGMINTKDYNHAAEMINKTFDKIICVGEFSENAVPPARLAELFNPRKTIPMPLRNAVMYAKSITNGTIIYCGSLYLVSEILKKY